ncbi:MAG: glycerophosphodiester phosphodiesterase [Lachnospiraceae bacterium]|nr:glycerophosphodiester phosphodiesterase [Lachnospiraceae bacterium]
MKNYAHRGFSGKYPENTMIAFRNAVKAGADGIELDVQFSKDGVLVICHDEKVDRTTDGKGFIKDFTLEELKRLDASGKFAGVYGKQEIPTFREYLEMIADTGLETNIELKTGRFEYPGIEQAVYDMVKEFGLEERVLISSFNHFSVMRMKKIAPELKTGFLTEAWIMDAGAYTERHGVDSYNPEYYSLTEENVAEIKAHGRMIYCYTVNDEETVRDLFFKGVDCVIGNHPDMAKRVIAKCEAERSAAR